MKFTISTQDNRTFVSLLWYIENILKNTNTNHFFTGDCLNYDIQDNRLIDFAAFDNEFTFFYEDEEIKITRERIGEPTFINSRCEVGFMEEIIMNFEKNYMDIYNLYGVKLYNLENLVFDQNIISNKFNYLLIFNENDGLYIVNFVNGDFTKIDLESTIYNKISYLCLEYPEIYIGTNNGNIYKLGF